MWKELIYKIHVQTPKGKVDAIVHSGGYNDEQTSTVQNG